ncbi:MAG: hypothetical protein KDK89_02590 [Alphaproteobacteria bacterium]|nr:hypothetical protein [Alphaproteobacteria bacterium]
MKHIGKSGAVLAAAALSLAMSGFAVAPAQADDAKVHCVGVNSCKGQSECKTASSSCKGLNACKGQGFLAMTKADCDAAGGKVEG